MRSLDLPRLTADVLATPPVEFGSHRPPVWNSRRQVRTLKEGGSRPLIGQSSSTRPTRHCPRGYLPSLVRILRVRRICAFPDLTTLDSSESRLLRFRSPAFTLLDPSAFTTYRPFDTINTLIFSYSRLHFPYFLELGFFVIW